MIPNHKQFIEAIHDKHKVCLRFYSLADSGVVDLVCAPTDYGPGSGAQVGVNRYWFWDYTSNTGTPAFGLLPEQVLDLRVLGELFDPAVFVVPATTESILCEEKAPAPSGTNLASPGLARTKPQLNPTEGSHPVKLQQQLF